MDYSGQCASNLDFLPPFPHQKETISSNRIGVLLNLSNNYITSSSLFTSSIVQNAEWRSFLVQLDLQGTKVRIMTTTITLCHRFFMWKDSIIPWIPSLEYVVESQKLTSYFDSFTKKMQSQIWDGWEMGCFQT